MARSKKYLLISVPSPCTEDWEQMSLHEKGKFCHHCKKEVIDFSTFSDRELYTYFLKAKPNLCGRMRSSQVGHFVSPPATNKSWWNIPGKIAAAVALLNIQPAVANSQSTIQTSVNAAPKISVDRTNSGIVTISGTISDWKGNLLEGATVYVGDSLYTKTDIYGKYSFELPVESPSKGYMLFFAYPEMITVIRNYHPAMQSTAYDVVLSKPVRGIYPAYYAGGITFDYVGLDTFQLAFKPADASLDKDCKNELSTLALLLRNHPTLRVEFVGYIRNPKNRKLVQKNLQAIIDYLQDTEGISMERLETKIVPSNKKKENIIEVTQYEGRD